MNNELIRYANGSAPVPLTDRAVARRARAIYNETRLAALKADGAMALAGHLMEGLVSLDAHRKALSGGDPLTDVMLAEIEAAAVRQVTNIQRRLYNGWNLE